MSNRTLKFFSVFLLIVASLHCVEINLPVSKTLVLKLSLSIKKLQSELKDFGTFKQNNLALWKRTQLTKKYLIQCDEQLKKYNNVISGTGNQIKGNKNIIIGNYNQIQGNNNWVFISKYTGNFDGNLLISKWRIQLQKSNLIMINPSLAISFLDQSKNRNFFRKFFSTNRKFCQWESWGQVNNKKYQHWNQYYGFDQFVKEWARHSSGSIPAYSHHGYGQGEKQSQRKNNLKREEDSEFQSERDKIQGGHHGGYYDLFGRNHQESKSRGKDQDSSSETSSDNSKGFKGSKGSEKDSDSSSSKSKKSKNSDKDSDSSSNKKYKGEEKNSDSDSGSDKQKYEVKYKYKTENNSSGSDSDSKDSKGSHRTYNFDKNWGW